MDYISLLTQVLVHIIHTGSYDVCAVAASGSYQPLGFLAAMIDRLQLTTTYTIYIDTLPASARCNMLVAFVHDATEFEWVIFFCSNVLLFNIYKTFFQSNV